MPKSGSQGPLNYNPVEEWFFHRLKAGRPIPVPNSGMQVGSLLVTALFVGSALPCGCPAAATGAAARSAPVGTAHALRLPSPSCSPASVHSEMVQVTQLGHVKDLATAFVKILGNPRAARQVYNISGER